MIDTPAPEVQAYPIERQIACIKRELFMRQQVYPGRIAINKMTAEKAHEEMECMKAVLATLESLPAAPTDTTHQAKPTSANVVSMVDHRRSPA